MDRRSFVKSFGLAAGGAVALAGTGRLLTRPAFADLAMSQVRPLPDPVTSGLDHIVVLMMENRSYDHYLWWLPGGDGVRDQTFHDPDEDVDKTTENWGASGRADFNGCADGDPHHGWTSSREQMLHGFLAESNPDYGLAYYEPQDIPAIAGLAAGYTAYDRWYCSVMGPTFPNREYLLSGTSGGNRGNCFPVPGQNCSTENEAGDTDFDQIPDSGLQWPTVFDRLNDAGVSWRIYIHDIGSSFLFGERILGSGNIFTIDQYEIDAATGQLPHFAFIEPRYDNAYTGIGNDDHWPHDIRLGQELISRVFFALANSPQWARSAFVLTYDEHGGFFDHVRPPRTRDDRANGSDLFEDYSQLGFRVPTVVASPFARRGFVGHATYDHASVLKLLEWRFRLSPLTTRDAAARNLAEVFDWDNPVLDLPDGVEPYTAPILTGPFCPGGQNLGPISTPVPDPIGLPLETTSITWEQARAAGHRAAAPAEGRDHDLSRLFEAGFIEKLGYRLPFETGLEVPTRIAGVSR